MNYITMPGIRQTSNIKRIVNMAPTQISNAERICEAVSRYYSLDSEDLKNKSRKRDVCTARQIAMYLMCKTTSMSLVSIGNYFNGKDHTTVIHSRNNIKDLIKYDEVLRMQVAYIQNSL